MRYGRAAIFSRDDKLNRMQPVIPSAGQPRHQLQPMTSSREVPHGMVDLVHFEWKYERKSYRIQYSKLRYTDVLLGLPEGKDQLV